MMRKTMVLPIMLVAVLAVCAGEVKAQCQNKTNGSKHTWHKSVEGTWKGKCNGLEYTYRISNGKLRQQFNGGEWTDVADSVWYDYSGKRFRYINSAVSSTNDGVNWSPVSGSYWLSSNGYWYRLDKNEEIWWDKFDKMEKMDY